MGVRIPREEPNHSCLPGRSTAAVCRCHIAYPRATADTTAFVAALSRRPVRGMHSAGAYWRRTVVVHVKPSPRNRCSCFHRPQDVCSYLTCSCSTVPLSLSINALRTLLSSCQTRRGPGRDHPTATDEHAAAPPSAEAPAWFLQRCGQLLSSCVMMAGGVRATLDVMLGGLDSTNTQVSTTPSCP